MFIFSPSFAEKLTETTDIDRIVDCDHRVNIIYKENIVSSYTKNELFNIYRKKIGLYLTHPSKDGTKKRQQLRKQLEQLHV